MTDEGRQDNPMDEVELVNSLRNLATGARTFYVQLVEEGFTAADALRLTGQWLHGMSGGNSA